MVAAQRDLELIREDTIGLRESEKELRGTRAGILQVRTVRATVYELCSAVRVAVYG
jgi:hypothetical protein